MAPSSSPGEPASLAGPVPGPVEQAIGLQAYLTHTPGIGGQLKVGPEDFRVDEVSRYPLPQPQGKYTIVRVEAYDIEQNTLISRLQRALRLPPGSIGFAGTKDRRAISTQLLSLPVTPEDLRGLNLSGVRLLEPYRSDERLSLGHLYGNRFRLRLSAIGLPLPDVVARTRGTLEELRGLGGFPNYFGPQRFGEVRPVTHLVGKALVLGSAAQAVDCYLTQRVEGEDREGQDARRLYAEHHDPVQALKEFPFTFEFERSLLDQLARGHDAARALRALPRSLRQLFVHAYQSYLFNLALSRRIERGLSLRDPIEGDVLVRLAPDGLDRGDPPIPVSRDNLTEATDLARRGRARAAGTLVGTETPVPAGEPGGILTEILRTEGVAPEDFHIPEAPEISSRGTYRALLAPLPPHVFRHGEPSPEGEGGDGALSLVFDFVLEKGQYATVLLREFRKAGALAPPAPGLPRAGLAAFGPAAGGPTAS